MPWVRISRVTFAPSTSSSEGLHTISLTPGSTLTALRDASEGLVLVVGSFSEPTQPGRAVPAAKGRLDLFAEVGGGRPLHLRGQPFAPSLLAVSFDLLQGAPGVLLGVLEQAEVRAVPLVHPADHSTEVGGDLVER